LTDRVFCHFHYRGRCISGKTSSPYYRYDVGPHLRDVPQLSAGR